MEGESGRERESVNKVTENGALCIFFVVAVPRLWRLWRC